MVALVYATHYAFWLPFAARLIAKGPPESGESTATAPGASRLVLLHTIPFGVMEFGLGMQVFATPPGWLGYGVGAAITAVGAALAAWSMWVFRSWRFRAAVDQRHELCLDGPFGWVRHPIYTALDCYALGVVAFAPNWATLAGALGILVVGDLRGRAEERLLTGVYGERYSGPMSKVARFLPGIY